MNPTLITNLLKRSIPYIVGIVLVTLFCIFIIRSCKSQIAENKIQIAEKEVYKNHLIDSVKDVYSKQNIADLEKLQRKNDTLITYYRTSNDYWKGVANSNAKSAKKNKHLADSLAKTKPEFEEIANLYKLGYDSLEKANQALDSANFALDNEAKTYSDNLYLEHQKTKQLTADNLRKDTTISTLENANTLLEKKVDSNPGYWKGFWTGYKYGFGSAVVLETGALILLKK